MAHRAVVRTATAADARGIATVHAVSWRETYAHLVDGEEHPAFQIEPRVARWEQNLASGSFGTVVAVVDGAVVGFATTADLGAPDQPAEHDQPAEQRTEATTAHPSAAHRPTELTMLYVLAAAHGTGIGQALLDAALADRPASLWVAADNPRAQAFYRRNGFRTDGTTGAFPPIGATVRMVR
ncbi:GNAT family N-acetyltransferase [Curtobacterium sp. MCBD17_035]|uniref:GNAT family N-acetyltransferase n=1 Tax=Curtobacterium sp. MCBD17_035 TaxID=2175673 RepID=UPI000DAAA2AB|nr:GNAT family N-acetyltransferase [Curtobacterium sp. MCBD17_035]WIB67807.1 GNAT family N-acetyltransferase [Curtobacterium sp. MCBD17_035]